MSKYGPDVTKLITRFIARIAIPPGGGSGLADGIEFFTNPEWRKQVCEQAEAEALAGLRAIKAAPDNPYGDDDEVIAGVLLKMIEERNENQRTKNLPR